MEITRDKAIKVLDIVSGGLIYGKGNGTKGSVCVEQAVAISFDEGDTDRPTCVSDKLRRHKISLNDQYGWDDEMTRAEGMKRVAIAQLGSVNVFDNVQFDNDMSAQLRALINVDQYIQDAVTRVKEETAKALNLTDLRVIKDKIDFILINVPYIPEYYGVDIYRQKIRAYRPLWGTNKILAFIAEMMVQACINQKIPGTQFLDLTDVPDFSDPSTTN